MSSENADKTKKTTTEYISELKEVAKSGKTMLVYVFKRAPWLLIAFTAAMVLMALLPFLSHWLNSKVIDELVALLAAAGSIGTLYYIVGAAIGAMLFRTLVSSLRDFAQLHIWYVVGRELSHDVTKKFSSLDVEYYEDSETLDLLNKVTDNYTARPQQFFENIFWLLDSIVSVISAIFILVFFQPIFILVLILTTFPEVVVNVIFGRRSYGIWDAKGDVKRDYYQTRRHLMSESSLIELKIFKVRNYFLERTYNLFTDFQNEQIKIENRRSLITISARGLSILGYGILFLITVNSVLNQTITIGQFTFYMATVGNLQGNLTFLFRQLSRIYENGLYVNDIFKVLGFKEKIVAGTVILPETTTPPEIKFNDVTFYYPGTKEAVFENLYLTINPKDHVAIVGENGSGKTTLIKLLMRFYDVSGGEILIDGINIKDLDFDSWYSKVGALFQEFNFYHFDAKTNIGVGNVLDLQNIDKITASSQKSGAHEFIDKYEKGYDQILSRDFKDGIKPSVGQKQKIALARAFFKDAPILILDEPTSAIDPKAEFEIFERLFEFANEKTVIIISHRFSTVRNAGRIIVLDKGKIIEDGAHEDLMKVPDGKYKTAFEIQKRGYE